MLLGGNALVLRTGGGRFTQDIDLAHTSSWRDTAELRHVIEEQLKRSTAETHGFKFIVDRVEPHSEKDPYGYGTKTAKVKIQVRLGNQLFDEFSIDATDRHLNDGSPDHLSLIPPFADQTLEKLPVVPTVPVENHLADKICAMYETHGERNLPSTRFRDLADIVRIIQDLSFSAAELHQILLEEAARRKMNLPTSLLAPGRNWHQAFPAAARNFAGFPKEYWDLDAALFYCGTCLDPILTGSLDAGTWWPDTQSWAPAP